MLQLFHDGVTYHIEISPMICSVNQWTGFYMIRTSVMKELNPFYLFPLFRFFSAFFSKCCNNGTQQTFTCSKSANRNTMFKVNNNLKTPERRHRGHSGIFIVHFEYISLLFLVFLMLTLNK